MRYALFAGFVGLAAVLGCVPASAPSAVPASTRAGSSPGVPPESPPDAAVPLPNVPDEDLKELARGNNEFAVELFKKVAETEKGNIVLSPYSIRTALAMVYAGARGETKEEMKRVLRFTLPDERLHAAIGKVEEPRTAKDEPILETANALWCQRGWPLKPDYRKLVQAHYRAAMQEVDFAGDPSSALPRINGWITDKTRGKIPGMLTGKEVSEYTSFVLANAVYFKGEWLNKFEKELTKSELFHSTKGAVMVDTMHREITTSYSEQENAMFVSLSYSGASHSLILIVPDENDGLPKIESKLTEERLRSWLAASETARVQLSLPRFVCRQTLDMRTLLDRLGMAQSFGPQADFSGLSSKRFDLKSIIHSALIETDETGTEAAAVTLISGDVPVGEPAPFPEVIVRADKPFLFLLRDNRTKHFLFVGRVQDVAKE